MEKEVFAPLVLVVETMLGRLAVLKVVSVEIHRKMLLAALS
jgi:hypothetical protein